MPASAPAPQVVSHRRVLAIAAPIIVSNATVPLLGLVNTGVIGQMGAAAPIGAVGLGAVILATFYWIFGFLRMGTTGLAAQAHGRGDGAERTAVLLRALLIGLAAGAVLVAAQGALFAAAFRLAPASAEVEQLARQYLSIRIWGAPATIALYAVNGWLIAQERTRAVLLLQVVMNGLNILLDIWFVIGLGLGVPGVAQATLLAEYAGLALGLWLCRDGLAGWSVARGRLFDPAPMLRMMQINGDIMIRSVLLQGAFTCFLFFGAGLGDLTLAANQVLLQFLELTAYLLDGFAFAAETLVGQAIGARTLPALRHSVRLAFGWGIAGALLLAALFGLAGGGIIDLMTTAPDVRETARQFLPWLVAAPVIGVAGWIWDGIFIGAIASREMRNAMVLCVALFGAALAVLLPLLGNHGLWAALMVLSAARGLTLSRAWPAIAARLGATT